MTYLVVILRIDDAAKDIAGHFLLDRTLDGADISIRIVDLGDHAAHDVHHRVIPLAVKFEASRTGLECHVSGTLQILGDGDLAWLLRVSVAVCEVDLPQKLQSLAIGGA